ncbi:hypothetical protein HDU97_004967 [Phlyctochytrium planicorne]|nr:hypothetical protein HDU97_004967 [Phlyctochytrium planicorne]
MLFSKSTIIAAAVALFAGAASAADLTAGLPTCSAACTMGDPSFLQTMVDYDSKAKPLPDLTKCARQIEKANLPMYNMQGPFVTNATAGQNVVDTIFGPLDDADRFLVQSVRRAGLWEEPSGRRTETDAACSQVKTVGKQLASDHILLDNASKEVADALGIQLPDDLTPQQQQFMTEMACASSPQQWEATFAMRLRQAHGSIFGTIAEVRAKTRNDMIRQFATVANAFVLKHMQLLESTSLISYVNLPSAVVATPPPEKKNLQNSFNLSSSPKLLLLPQVTPKREGKGPTETRRERFVEKVTPKRCRIPLLAHQ